MANGVGVCTGGFALRVLLGGLGRDHQRGARGIPRYVIQYIILYAFSVSSALFLFHSIVASGNSHYFLDRFFFCFVVLMGSFCH